MTKEVWVILKQPSGPESDFVETEDENGQGVGGFQWVEHGDLWALGPFARASVLGELETLQTNATELKDAALAFTECLIPYHDGLLGNDEVEITVTVDDLRRLKKAREAPLGG